MLKFCYFVAAVHLAAFFVSVPIANLNEGWNSVFVWGVWSAIDFPISILHFILPDILSSFHFDNEFFKYILYPPYLIHGVLGTIWWFFLPRIYYKIKRNK